MYVGENVWEVSLGGDVWEVTLTGGVWEVFVAGDILEVPAGEMSGMRLWAGTVYSGYSGHVCSGHSDIVATFTGTKYIYSIIFRSDIVANWI